ncbi:MAG: transglycosylase domain-containing protein [Candidatus Peribacter sp.]|nr:transglycosylase domain-containing protein [Candidatus Peribacter sp.]
MASLSPPAGHTRPAKARQSILFHSLLANVLVFGVILAMQLLGLWGELSTIAVSEVSLPQTVILTDARGGELRRLYMEQDRLELADDAFPQFLRQAVVAIEDERFFSRGCVDIRAIGRALIANAQQSKAQGASTITQQLVGNLFLDRSDKSYARKSLEILLACRLEHTVSRDRILSMYLNHMAFGGALYGAEEASQTYFGVSARSLTLAQSAVLASLLQRPTYFSPYGIHLHTAVTREVAEAVRQGRIRSVAEIPPDQVTPGLIGIELNPSGSGVYLEGRTDLVLRAMQDREFIGEARRLAALKELKSMQFNRRKAAVVMPYFSLFVGRQLNEGSVRADRPCDARAGGCIVETTLDPDLQALAERIVLEHAEEIRTKYRAHNIALVAADRATGGILAYIGNVRFSDTGSGSMIDMARVARQPGSSFKPFVYAAAFAAGMNPTTFLLDAPLTLGPDQPRNYEGGYRGWTQISHALAASRNIPAIRTMLMIGGEEPVLQMAARTGIVTPLQTLVRYRRLTPAFTFGYPLAIGSAEVPLLEMVQGYLTLANAGYKRPLTTIHSIHTVEGIPLDRRIADGGVQAIESLHARWLTSILSDTHIRPTPGWNEALTVPGIQTAMKTGTSDRCAGIDPASGRCILLPGDLWTLGYSPEFVLGIWVGNADYSPLSPTADGMNVVAPLWKEFIAGAHALRPDGLTYFPPELIEKKRRE